MASSADTTAIAGKPVVSSAALRTTSNSSSSSSSSNSSNNIASPLKSKVPLPTSSVPLPVATVQSTDSTRQEPKSSWADTVSSEMMVPARGGPPAATSDVLGSDPA